MTVYVTIASGDLDAESPIDTDLMTALARNPDAYAEDDATCPTFKGRVKASGIESDGSIANVAVASGQTMMVWATGSIYSNVGGPGSDTLTVSIKHNGTTLASETFTRTSSLDNEDFSFALTAITNTVATGTLEVTVTSTASGGSNALKISYLKFNTP